MVIDVVSNRKTSQLGIKQHIVNQNEEKTWGSNYKIVILDPVTFEKTQTKEHYSTDWISLEKNDPRYQFLNLFEIIDSADWMGHDETNDCYIKNQVEVFSQIRKLFLC